MGNDILKCTYCNADIMEVRNSWECDCGAICNTNTDFQWKKEVDFVIINFEEDCFQKLQRFFRKIPYKVSYYNKNEKHLKVEDNKFTTIFDICLSKNNLKTNVNVIIYNYLTNKITMRCVRNKI